MKKKNVSKSIVIVSDFHCGAEVGLSPTPTNPTQKTLLGLYNECIKSFGYPDILVLNGDAVDGDQYKSGGRGLEEDDLNQQDLMAVDLIKMWHPKEVFMVGGTPYHVGETEHEQNISNLLTMAGVKSSYTRKLNLMVNKWFKMQCRHFIPSSGVPQSRATAAARAKVWENLNAGLAGEKASDLSVYSHVHYFGLLQDAFGTTITTPAWEAVGGVYGDEKMDGHIDVGAIKIIVGATEKDGWTWEKKLFPAKTKKRSIER